jgi:predicted RNA-binding Zn-ribbon protein involved in translation (DUF1610 family)
VSDDANATTTLPDRQVLLRRFLAQRDVDCSACGYSLHGLTGEACPECGATIELKLLPRRMSAGHVVLVSLCAIAVGFSLPVFFNLVALLLSGTPALPLFARIAPLLIVAALWLAVLSLLLWRSGVLLRLRGGAVWLLNVICAIAAVLSHGLAWWIFL